MLTKLFTFAYLCSLFPGAADAGDLTLNVFDPAGHGVSDVVVTLTAQSGSAARPAPPSPAIMDQRHLAFLPRILVVAVGTLVEFPNSDTVSHQVYSFSPAKRFQLPLYKGQIHSPVTFGQEGLVVLGCNIHDQMVGYIYVTAAPYHGLTDAVGSLRIPALAAGAYRLSTWSPFIADPAGALVRDVQVAVQEATEIRIQLTRPLRARPEPGPRRADWEY